MSEFEAPETKKEYSDWLFKAIQELEYAHFNLWHIFEAWCEDFGGELGPYDQNKICEILKEKVDERILGVHSFKSDFGYRYDEFTLNDYGHWNWKD